MFLARLRTMRQGLVAFDPAPSESFWGSAQGSSPVASSEVLAVLTAAHPKEIDYWIGDLRFQFPIWGLLSRRIYSYGSIETPLDEGVTITDPDGGREYAALFTSESKSEWLAVARQSDGDKGHVHCLELQTPNAALAVIQGLAETKRQPG